MEKMEKVLQKIDSGRSYRNMQVMEVRALPPDQEEQYIVEGYAATFDEPYYLYGWEDYTVNEQIDSRAFEECDMSDVIFQFDHAGRVYARTSNKTLEVKVDNKGLYMRADLSGTEEGRKLFEEIKGGYVTKMSFGFKVAEDKRESTYDTSTSSTCVLRTITKIEKLYDVSAVSIPANDGTEISARNFGEGVIEEMEAERRRAAEQVETECLALLNL